jgi:hypothetical protein
MARRWSVFMKVMEELARQAGPAREVRMIELRFAKAAAMPRRSWMTSIRIQRAPSSIKGGAEPVFEPIEANNALMVAAQPSQFAIVDSAGAQPRHAAVDGPPAAADPAAARSTDAAKISRACCRTSYEQPPCRAARQGAGGHPGRFGDEHAHRLGPPGDVLPEIEQIVTRVNEQQRLRWRRAARSASSI